MIPVVYQSIDIYLSAFSLYVSAANFKNLLIVKINFLHSVAVHVCLRVVFQIDYANRNAVDFS